MNENFERRGQAESISAEKLVNDIQSLREASLNSIELNDTWNGLVKEWDDTFKIQLIEKFGTTKSAQEVPAWQVLIGGTPEEEVSITEEERDFILHEVAHFLYEVLQPAIEEAKR